VRKKQEAAKGGPAGRLLEPEELDRLEAEGYLGGTEQERQARTEAGGDEEMKARRLAEEEARFLQELEMHDQDINDQDDEQVELEVRSSERIPQRPSRHVEIEEVEDEDG